MPVPLLDRLLTDIACYLAHEAQAQMSFGFPLTPAYGNLSGARITPQEQLEVQTHFIQSAAALLGIRESFIFASNKYKPRMPWNKKPPQVPVWIEYPQRGSTIAAVMFRPNKDRTQTQATLILDKSSCETSPHPSGVDVHLSVGGRSFVLTSPPQQNADYIILPGIVFGDSWDLGQLQGYALRKGAQERRYCVINSDKAAGSLIDKDRQTMEIARQRHPENSEIRQMTSYLVMTVTEAMQMYIAAQNAIGNPTVTARRATLPHEGAGYVIGANLG